ncbi:MAG TPA: twin-arginine translocase TatA/TatE family subunit [Candidatus Acidoferrales bacterium]|nr:twin-arginine translocase TatA/TatE family subunit [Candidatus Acidoferrales bacterium]
MGPLGWPETVFIFFLALILFGPKKLPELGRTVGKALTEFRRASNELKATFDREMKSLEQVSEVKELKEIANQYQADTYNYDYSSHESTYEGAYGGENYDYAAANPSTESASAPQGAESPSAVLPEGAVAHGTETAVVHESSGHEPGLHEPEAASNGHNAPAPTTEHNA